MKEIIEQYMALKSAQSALEEKIKEIKEMKLELERKMLDELNKTQQDGAVVGNVKVMRTTKRVYNADDWVKVHQYIMRTQDFSLLQARLSSTRIKELEADGYSVEAMGIKPTDLQEVSIRQATRS